MDDESADVPEWTPAPRRNWVKVFAAAAAVVVVGAASWALFMDHPSGGGDASTVSATAGSVALHSKAAKHPAAQPAPEAASPAPGETSHPGRSRIRLPISRLPNRSRQTSNSLKRRSTPRRVRRDIRQLPIARHRRQVGYQRST